MSLFGEQTPDRSADLPTPAPGTPRSEPGTQPVDPIPPSVTRESFLDAGRDPGEPDWPAQATELVVSLVGKVRDKTTGTILTVAKGLVFGSLAAMLALVVVVLLMISAIRLLTEITGHVWISYLTCGAIMTIAGAIVFSKRHPPSGATTGS